MDKAQKGFTLIELVVVITILGILAAFAFPRFAALEVEARAATIEGIGGSLRSAASLAHSLSLVQGSPATVTMEGQVITLVNGYPNLASIENTLIDITGFTVTVDPGVDTIFQKDGAPAGTCDVTYVEAAAAGAPGITVDTSAC